MVLPERVGKADKNGPLLRGAPDTRWPVSFVVRLRNCVISSFIVNTKEEQNRENELIVKCHGNIQ